MGKGESNRSGKKVKVIEKISEDKDENSNNHINMNIRVCLPGSDFSKSLNISNLENSKVVIKYSIGKETKVFNLPLYPQLNSPNSNTINKRKFKNPPSVHQNQLIKDRLQIFVDSMVTNAMVAESRDHSSMTHIIRMSNLIELLAQELSQDDSLKEQKLLSPDFIKTLKFASLLHDLGKLMIPEKILQKQSLLEAHERKKVNEHTELGVKLLKSFIEPNLWKGKLGNYCRVAKEVIKYHHAYFILSDEYYFGTDILKGYPKNIGGKDIPLTARIAAVADVFEALTSKERMYPRRTKEGLHWKKVSIEEVFKVIKKEEKGHFDPDVVNALERLLKKGELKSAIDFNIESGEIDKYKEDFFNYLLDNSSYIKK